MSLFDKLNNKRYDLQEASSGGKKKGYGSQEDIRQKYKDDLAKKKGYVLNPTEKKKGMRLGDKLEKDIDLGARLQDKTIGKRTPKQAYAQGMPFQPDDNPATKFQRSNKGRYPTSGKSILNKRFQYQSDIKSSEREAVKSRLKTRLGYVSDPKFKDTGEINKFVDDVTKNQKLSTATGKDSTLFKTLKKYTDAKEPTRKGRYGKPARMVKGKDGVVRQYGGGKLPMPDSKLKKYSKRKAAAVEKGLKKFDDDLVKGANIPKGTYIPKGGVPARSDIKTRKVTYTRPFEPKELNLQFKADKLKLDYGGRIAERDPKIAGMTAAQKKKNYEKVKARIDKKNPTFKSPVSGGKLPVTPENMKKYKVNKQGFTKGQVFRNTVGKTAMKGVNKFKSLGFRGKAGVIGGVALGGYLAYQGAKKLLSPATLTNKDFTSTAPIKDRSGQNVRFKYDKKAENMASPYLGSKTRTRSDGTKIPSALTKFKTGAYNVATKSGKPINVNQNMKQSAFEKQIQKAQKNPNNKKNQQFLKKFKNATRPT